MTLEPKLLTDKTRLQEIYDLRVDVWEHSEKSDFVNRKLFPKGWLDIFDKTANHWIIENEKGKIIAAARLNIFTDLAEFPYKKFTDNIVLPNTHPFAFYSRLIIHPNYQGNGLSSKLDTVNLIKKNFYHFKWWFMFATDEREKSLTINLGYTKVGIIDVSYHKSTTPHKVGVYIKIKEI